MFELLCDFHEVNIIGGDRLTHFLGLRIQDVQRCGARGKIDIATGEIVGLVSGNIVKPKGFWSRVQRFIYDLVSEDRMEFIHIDLAAVIGKHCQNRFIVNLDSERTEYVSCFANYLLDKFIS